MNQLDRKNIEDILSLTPMQEGMLFHYLENKKGSQYFEQLSLEISGEIDERYFEQAWHVVVETNEMLRTRFQWEKIKEPVQVILGYHQNYTKDELIRMSRYVEKHGPPLIRKLDQDQQDRIKADLNRISS